MTRTLKWFDSLSKRDFENQAVLDEIRAVFKERDQLIAFQSHVYERISAIRVQMDKLPSLGGGG